MMHLVFLIMGLTVLLMIVRKMVAVEMRQTPSNICDEEKHNAIILLWGAGIIFLLLFIPYQAWRIAGSSLGLNGVLVMITSLLGSVLLCLAYYSLMKGRRLRAARITSI